MAVSSEVKLVEWRLGAVKLIGGISSVASLIGRDSSAARDASLTFRAVASD